MPHFPRMLEKRVESVTSFPAASVPSRVRSREKKNLPTVVRCS